MLWVDNVYMYIMSFSSILCVFWSFNDVLCWCFVRPNGMAECSRFPWISSRNALDAPVSQSTRDGGPKPIQLIPVCLEVIVLQPAEKDSSTASGTHALYRTYRQLDYSICLFCPDGLPKKKWIGQTQQWVREYTQTHTHTDTHTHTHTNTRICISFIYFYVVGGVVEKVIAL